MERLYEDADDIYNTEAVMSKSTTPPKSTSVSLSDRQKWFPRMTLDICNADYFMMFFISFMMYFVLRRTHV